MIDNTIVDGNRELKIETSTPMGAIESSFSSPFYPKGLGGVNIPTGVALGRDVSTLTIVDNDSKPGVLTFAQTNYTVNESTKFAVVSVTRTNGSSGTVQVNYSTSDGTATTPADYLATAGTLTFGPGVTNGTFTVQIINDTVAEDDESIMLHLSNVSGGATLGATNAVLTIIDNDSPNGRLNFSSANYATNENAGAALVTINRTGGSQGTLAVYFATSNGTAVAGSDYIGVTNVLTWNPGDIAPKTISITVFDNGLVDGNRTINLRLFSATVNGVTNLNVIGSVGTSVLTILDDDAYGTVAFTSPVYNVNENGGPAFITVHRTAGIAHSRTVNFATAGGTAVPGFDYTPTNGVLVFAPGELSKTFTVSIQNNNVQDAPRFVGLTLSNASPVSALGFPSTALLNIIDDESNNEPAGTVDTTTDPSFGADGDVFALALQPNGMILIAGDFSHANNVSRNRIARLNPNCSLDSSFSYATGGANAPIRAMACQSDGRILVGGFFTSFNGTIQNHLARVNYAGSLDSTFNIGAGADNSVFAMAETFVGGARKILVGGAFLNLNGISRSGIGRLNDDGTVDGSFNSGIGANGPVYAVVPYPTNSSRAGQVIIGGDFTSVNGVARPHIARLNRDGSVDSSFTITSGANDSVRALVLQPDEHIVMGGLFTNVNGINLHNIARLNPNGTIDNSFNPGVGGNDAVYSIALQPDGKLLLGGQFTVFTGVTRHRLTRLNADGSVDPTINFGLGADSFVASVLVQPDDRILLGGGFTQFDGAPAPHVTRIYGRSINGSGTLEFDSASYQVNENGTNAVVTVRRRGGTSGAPTGNIFATMATSNNTAIAGVDYVAVVTNISFPPGEVVQSVAIPIIDNALVNPDRMFDVFLSNPQPVGGPTIGNQAHAVVNIINDDSAVSFSSPTYSVNEDTSLGGAVIQLVRTGSTNSVLSVDFLTTTNGTALPGVNYVPVTNTLTFAAGQTLNTVQVPVLHDPAANGDRTVGLALSNVIGGILLTPSSATLTIIDIERAPGQFVFSSSNYFVGEGGGAANITVLRTNGHTGVVTVHFATVDGTAVTGVDYFATNGFLTFADGETSKTFTVPVIDDNIVKTSRSLQIVLSAPTGGSSLGMTNATLTILDNDVGIGFSTPVYSVSEGAGSITVSVLRLNGSNGVASVNYATTNGTATAGSDYQATSGTLTFANGETLKTFTVPILEDSLVEGNEFFTVLLSNLQPPSAAQLVTASAAVTIIDDDSAFLFTNSVFSVSEGGGSVTVTVLRTNADQGSNIVSFTTLNGTATAGFDYVGTNGFLIFTNGEVSKSFSVTILEDTQVEGDEIFYVSLTNATGGAQIVSPNTAAVTIVDDDAGFKFSSPTYNVSEGGVSTTITVLRTGVLTNTVSVNYATQDGTAQSGQRYVGTSGTLLFTNGETSKTFTIQVIDDTIIEGDQTVLLTLSNPTGQSSLVSPSAAVLTIQDNDGSLISAAGASLISESGPVNGVIDPGEQVTLWFALRDTVGVNTTNLVATLLSGNGVAAPSGPQSYGALQVGGASVSRQFTFTASGTNGGTINATFQLQDGAVNLGTAVFTFALGSSSTTFSNNAAIVINDASPATPYPSSILVSGVNGSAASITVTLTNMSHAYPDDINVLLSGPAGQNVVLMANTGGGNSISNVTLTFDDSAAGNLPDGGQIVSGTYKPSVYATIATFPAEAPPAPYSTALSAYNGSNPNGKWSLFVLDDTGFDSGVIAQGWYLKVTTSSAIAATADLGLTVSASPNPVIVGSNLTFLVTVVNNGPSAASGVIITNPLPANTTFVSGSASQGGPVTTNLSGQIYCALGSLAKDGVATVAIVVRPTAIGTVTGTVTGYLTQTDPNFLNNTASASVTVVNPTADLALSMVGTPNPATLGNNVTFTLTATNIGPSSAPGLRLTNTLPAGVSFVSATAGYILVGSQVVYTNLGTLVNNGSLSVSITVHTVAPGTVTNTANVTSDLTDLFKGNNSASVKIVIDPVLLSAVRTGPNLVLSWPASVGSYDLESTPSLNAPVTWSPVSPPPQLIGGQMTVTVGLTNGPRLFRLHGVSP